MKHDHIVSRCRTYEGGAQLSPPREILDLPLLSYGLFYIYLNNKNSFLCKHKTLCFCQMCLPSTGRGIVGYCSHFPICRRRIKAFEKVEKYFLISPLLCTSGELKFNKITMQYVQIVMHTVTFIALQHTKCRILWKCMFASEVQVYV